MGIFQGCPTDRVARNILAYTQVCLIDTLSPQVQADTSKTNEEAVMKLALLSALAAFAVWPAFAQHAPSPQAIKFEDIKWEPLEGGGQISILYTNPTTKATYLIIRPEKDAHVPRHWHTANETITVLKGTFVLKHDDSDERSELTPGSFGYMPAKMVHEAWAKDDGATYFITTDGPFDINWVK